MPQDAFAAAIQSLSLSGNLSLVPVFSVILLTAYL